MNRAHQAYNDVGAMTDVMQASPHRQIQLLLEKCLTHMHIIASAIERNDYNQKHLSMGKAVDILNYLRLCLNFSDARARELSTLLNSIYQYVEQALMQANLKNSVEYIGHAKAVITTIKEGWDGITE